MLRGLLLLLACPTSAFVPSLRLFRPLTHLSSSPNSAKQANKLISENRQANFEYEFDETLEAGEFLLNGSQWNILGCRDRPLRFWGEELSLGSCLHLRWHRWDNWWRGVFLFLFTYSHFSFCSFGCQMFIFLNTPDVVGETSILQRGDGNY